MRSCVLLSFVPTSFFHSKRLFSHQFWFSDRSHRNATQNDATQPPKVAVQIKKRNFVWIKFSTIVKTVLTDLSRGKFSPNCVILVDVVVKFTTIVNIVLTELSRAKFSTNCLLILVDVVVPKWTFWQPIATSSSVVPLFSGVHLRANLWLFNLPKAQVGKLLQVLKYISQSFAELQGWALFDPCLFSEKNSLLLEYQTCGWCYKKNLEEISISPKLRNWKTFVLIVRTCTKMCKQ